MPTKAVSITCILAGVLVFAFPMLYQFGCFALVAYALANTHLPSMNISAPALENGYRFGSIGLGVLLTLFGMALAFLGRRPPLPAGPRPKADPEPLVPAGTP